MRFLPTAVLSLGGLAAAAAAVIATEQQDFTGSSLQVPGENPLEFCEEPDDHILTITKVDLDPNPPEKGKDLLITATGTLSEDVEDGSYVLLQVKYGLIRLINRNDSLCDDLKEVDRDCPLKKGDLTFQKTVHLPGEIPPGKFNVFADVYSHKGDKITCMEAKDISFSQASSKYIKGMLEL